jgi:hypothetical protein
LGPLPLYGATAEEIATPEAPEQNAGLGRDWRVEGIYRPRGDRLEICVTPVPDTEPRPTEFKTVRTHWTVHSVFERVKKPEK